MDFPFTKILLLTLILPLGSCISGVTVTKITEKNSNPKGLRVNLPAPFLVGRPNPANQIDWKIEYLPDPDEEYAVYAWSFMAKNFSDFTRLENGVLTKATLDMDTSAVATQLAKSGGAVTGAKLDAAAVQKTAVVKEQKERTADLADKSLKLEQSKIKVAAAQIEADLAKTKLDGAKDSLQTALDGGNEEAIKEAKDRVAAAEAAHEKAEKEWRVAQVEVSTAQAALNTSKDSFDTGEARIKKLENPGYTPTKLAPAPVIYRIAEDKESGGIKLEPVSFTVFSLNGESISKPQIKAATWGAKKEKKEETP